MRSPWKLPLIDKQASMGKVLFSSAASLSPSVGQMRARLTDSEFHHRTELSLREGDTVKIISKKAHNGWWRGEVYGRVGLFPANYVEEDHSDYC